MHDMTPWYLYSDLESQGQGQQVKDVIVLHVMWPWSMAIYAEVKGHSGQGHISD